MNIMNALERCFGWYQRIKIASLEPWQMTEKEFLDYHHTGHIRSDAYEQYRTSEGLDFISKDRYPIFLRKVKINNQDIEIRAEQEKLRYAKKDADGEYIRDEKGMVVFTTEQENIENNLPTFLYSIAAFVDENPIGFVSDEWGATGVFVVNKYQNLGIGSILLHEFMRLNPHRKTRRLGQMTSAGVNLARKYYRQSVQNAIAEGKPVPQHVLESFDKPISYNPYRHIE